MLKKGTSIFATAVLAATITNVSAEAVYHVTGDTDYAYLYAYPQGARVSLHINQVKSRGGNSNNYAYTTLYYSIYRYGEGYEYWSGRIDNNDVSGDANGNLILNTDTCAYAPRPSCGLVSVTWKKDGDYATHSSGVSRTETSVNITQETGTTTYYSSTASGTVNGLSLDNYYGYARQGSRTSTNLTITNK